MSLKIKNLTAKNVLSIGNVTQAVNFDRTDLTLVLGENLDMGGDDAGSRNGTGKTTILNALSYALYGSALTDIKKDNLINRTNGKGMLVTIEFEKNGVNYKIERGRRPGVLSFYKGDTAFESIDNDAQGDSRETQDEINKIVGMTHDMFRHILALNTYTEPFLRMKASDQRSIIEQLLGITMLSEKADKLKEQVRISKETIVKEEYRIAADIEANKKIEEQIESLKRRQRIWENKFAEECLDLQTQLDKLLLVDIDIEIKNHKLLEDYVAKQKDISDLELALSRGKKDLEREQSGVKKLLPEIENLENHTCHSCGQEIHNEKQKQLLDSKLASLEEHKIKMAELMEYIGQIEVGIKELGPLGTKPKTTYSKAADATHHKTSVDHLQKQLETKLLTENPYSDQIHEMETTALTEIDYGAINKAVKLKEHQEFLLKLLTNKDSFIRKRIIDQNLTYLNSRLSHYLDKIGLPHTVVFQNDLTVTIEELGRDLDFANLSRGESTRVILALSLAFRDVYETLFEPINLLIVDELIDSGMDSSGVENAMAILKRITRDTDKSIWLISHKDELTSRVSNILKVQKENGYTAWISGDE